MFGGDTFESQSTGKRMHGFAHRKEPEFSLGWEPNAPQLNEFQLRKIKNREITTKVTSSMLVIPDQSHLLRGEQLPPFEQGNKTRAKDQKVNSSLRVDPKKEETRIDCKLTVSSDARLAYENPDVPAEELEKMLEKYEGREAQRELDRGQGRSPQSWMQAPFARGSPVTNSASKATPVSGMFERRTPIIPKQSMRDILYNTGDSQKVESRVQLLIMKRNHSNLQSADSYSYYAKH